MGDRILTGFDVDARPILYMRPGRENTEVSPRQIQHLIYYLWVIPSLQKDLVFIIVHRERAIDFMPPGQEQVAIVVDVSWLLRATTPIADEAACTKDGWLFNTVQIGHVAIQPFDRDRKEGPQHLAEPLRWA